MKSVGRQQIDGSIPLHENMGSTWLCYAKWLGDIQTYFKFPQKVCLIFTGSILVASCLSVRLSGRWGHGWRLSSWMADFLAQFFIFSVHARIACITSMHLNQSIDQHIRLAILLYCFVNMGYPALNYFLHICFCDFFHLFPPFFFFFHTQELRRSTFHARRIFISAAGRSRITTSHVQSRGEASLKLTMGSLKRGFGVLCSGDSLLETGHVSR